MRRLTGHDDGDRQLVEILIAVCRGLARAVEAACAEALPARRSADVVLNILARQRDPAAGSDILTPGRCDCDAPVADCARYDRLQEAYCGAA